MSSASLDSTVRSESELFAGHPALLPGIGALLLSILTLGLALLYYLWRSRSLHYRITSQRVVIESGILSKKMEQIDLYRIRDYVVERPFGQRLMGTGNILLEAMDSTTPKLRVDGLKTDVVQLYEQLRVLTEADKKMRGVRLIE
jgi:uncharacterized membrane protein YdbT with pleckstrin-like domain